MAKTFNKIGIVQGQTVNSWHVSQSVDAFTGGEDYDIIISGSLTMTGSLLLDPSFVLSTPQEYLLAFDNTNGQLFYNQKSLFYTGSYTGSFIGDGSGLTGITGSLLTTASVNVNVITFTQGDGSTFDIIVNTGSQDLGNVLVVGNTTDGNDIEFTEGDNIIFKYSGFNNNINTSVLDSNRTILFPNNSGVVALTSDTASLLTTASVSLNTITFTQGDGSTFPITVDTGSTDLSNYVQASQTGSFLETASVSLNTITFTQADGSTFPITVDTGSTDLSNYVQASQTGSFLETASVSLNTITFTQGDGSTFPITVDTGSTDLSNYVQASQTGSFVETASVSLNTITFTQADGSTFPITVDTGSTDLSNYVQASQTGSFLETASVSLNTITFTQGDGSTFPITVDTGSVGNLLKTASVNLNTITFTKADGSTFPILVNTGSFSGSFSGSFEGGGALTGSLLITASSALNVVTFTKGDGSTFPILIDTGSTDLSNYVQASQTGSFVETASVSLNTITFTQGDGSTFPITVDTGSTDLSNYVQASQTGSFVETASVSLNTITFTQGDGSTFPITVDTGSTDLSNYVQSSQTGSFLETASVSLNTITFTQADGSTFPITVDTGSNPGIGGDISVDQVAVGNGFDIIKGFNSFKFVLGGGGSQYGAYLDIGLTNSTKGTINIYGDSDRGANIILQNRTGFQTNVVNWTIGANGDFEVTDGTLSYFNIDDSTGAITAPQTTPSDITTLGAKALITKEYGDANYLGGGATNTGSLLQTASVASNVITFTKGDGSTFPITVDTGSLSLQGYFEVGTRAGSDLYLGLGDWDLSGNKTFISLDDSTKRIDLYSFNLPGDLIGSGYIGIGNNEVKLQALNTGVQVGSVGNFFTALKTTNLNADRVVEMQDADGTMAYLSDITSITSSLLTTASVSLNTITFTKGDGSTFPITVDTGSGGGGSVNSVNPGTGITITGTATDPIINSTIYTLTEVLTAGTTATNGVSSLTLDPFNNNIYMQMYDISNFDNSRFILQPNKIELFHQFWDNDTPLNPGRGQADLLMESGSLRFKQGGKGVNVTSNTYVEFNEPVSGSITIKFPAATVPDASYNLAIQVTDGVTTVDADVEGVLNISSLLGGGATNTGSLLQTASVASNVITFTKGDGSTFPITVDTGSGGGGSTDTGSLLLTASANLNEITFTKGDGSTFPITVDTGSGTLTDTGSLLQTASVASNVITFTKGDGTTFPITVDTGSIDLSGYVQTDQTGSFTLTSSFNSFTGSLSGSVVTSGTELSLTNVFGTTYSTPTTPSSTTTYTTSSAKTIGGWNQTYISASASEPVVTGATLISGSGHDSGSLQFLTCRYNGVRAEYFFSNI